jgi:hypothetical protein
VAVPETAAFCCVAATHSLPIISEMTRTILGA